MTISNRWLAIFLVLPHLTIYYFSFDIIKPIIFFWQSVIILVALFISYKKMNVFNSMIFIFMFVITFSSLINGNLTGGILFSTIIFVSFFIYLIAATTNPKEFFTGLYYLFSVIIILNFITILYGGIDTILLEPIYLIGGRNAISMTIVPATSIISVYSYVKYNELKFIPLLIIIVGVISLFLVQSGTGSIIAILLTVFLFLKNSHKTSFKLYLIIYFSLFISIIILRLHELFFGDFIINRLNKNISLTGRTYIWDFIIENIKSSWLLGFGRGSNLINLYFRHINEAHNGLLEILFYSGIIGVSLFIRILLKVGRKLDTYKNNQISKIVAYSIFIYLIIGLSESVFLSKEFWMLLSFGFSINNLIVIEECKFDC